MGQSYSNVEGSGDRRATMSMTVGGIVWAGYSYENFYELIDGVTSGATSLYWNAQSVTSSLYLRFQFSRPRIIDEAKWYQDTADTHGTWKWQGSNDGSSWTDIGTSFTLGGSTTQTQTQLNGNSTAYYFYQLIGVSGTTSSAPYLFEMTFSTDDGAEPTPGASTTTSYANSGGTGDRTASITLTHNTLTGTVSTLLNGSFADTSAYFYWPGIGYGHTAGSYIRFDFGSGVSKVIDEIKFYQDSANNQGTWIWQGSNDLLIWDSLGSVFTITNATHVCVAGQNGNGYRYYQMSGRAGESTGSPYLREFEFKIADAGGAATAVPVFMNQYRQRRA